MTRFCNDPVSQGKFISLERALQNIKDGTHLVASMAAAEPTLLLASAHSRLNGLKGVTIHCANPSRDYPCFSENSLVGKVTFNVMFLTASIRKLQGHGMLHYIPQHLSHWAVNMRRTTSVDIFWGSCSPPDRHGYVSLGVGGCYESEMVRQAKCVILEVNPQMPFTYGGTVVPARDVTHFIENDHALASIPHAASSPIDYAIGATVASLVADGATIQLGIGSLPNAIGESLRTKRDLGVHTELINDAIFDLYERGVITGRHKTIWPEKIVGTFVYGSQKLYDFVDNNPCVELHPASVVNDPYRIGRNHRMISINSAVEIDLTGQVCSESVGHTEISGVGGASDTHTGAQRSEGGLGIIAMHAATDDEKFSKLVFELKPGAKVSISRNDIDTVVTEYGVAAMVGKSTAQRAKALIAIAHPKFRDELLASARRVGYI